MDCEKSCKKALSVVFIAVMAVFLLLILGQFVIKNVLIEAFHMESAIRFSVTGASDGMISVNFEEQYPFKEKEDAQSSDKNVIAKAADAWTGKIHGISKIVKGYSDDYLPLKEYVKVPSGLFDKIIDNRMVGPDNMYMAVGENGLIVRNPFKVTYTDEELDTSALAKNVVQLQNDLSEQGIEFMYVQTPVKEDVYDEEYVEQYGLSYENQLANNLLSNLKTQGVDVLDLRALMHDSGMNCYDGFFNSDNHWNIRTALWATGAFAQYLNENYGFKFDLSRFDENQYDEIVYKKWVQGTIGRSVTLVNADYDDVSVFVPKFETNLNMKVPTLQMDQTGSFLDTMVNPVPFKYRSTLYHGAYDAFAYSKPPVTKVKNLLEQNNNKKILLLRESFAGPVISYLSLGINELYAITPEGYNGSIQSYIEQVQPDMVVVFYTAPTTNEVTSKYDFR